MDPDLLLQFYNKFTSRLVLREYIRSDSRNFVVSPFSSILLLKMIAEMSPGSLRDDIAHLIDPALSFSQLISAVDESFDTFLKSPAIRAGKAVYFLPELKEGLHNFFKPAGLVRPGLEKRHVNIMTSTSKLDSWADYFTGSMFNAEDHTIFGHPVYSLINAMYFEGKWMQEYADGDIENKTMTGSAGEPVCVTIIQDIIHGYIEDRDVTGFVKPLKRSGCSLMVLLSKDPSRKSRINVLRKMNYSKLFQNCRSGMVRASIPEFHCCFQDDLTNFFDIPGFRDAFFKLNILPDTMKPYIGLNRIIHYSSLQIDRTGARAATVSAISEYLRRPPVQTIRGYDLENPFLYVIMHNRTKLPLFIGILGKP